MENERPEGRRSIGDLAGEIQVRAQQQNMDLPPKYEDVEDQPPKYEEHMAQNQTTQENRS